MNSKNRKAESGIPDLSIIIPLFDEAESIKELYSEICTACQGLNFEIVFVDDCSRDNSFQILEEIHNQDPRVKVIKFRRNFGKSEGLAAGFSVAKGNMIVTMDADLQDDPAEIPNMIAKLQEGHDLVSGWKKKRKDPWTKRVPSWFWNRLVRAFSGLKIHDFNCGFKIYRREVIETINVYGELHRYIPALAQWEGFLVTELPVNHRRRKYGKSKFGASRFLKGILDLITIVFLSRYTKRPLHVFGFIGFCSFLVGGGITAYLIVLRITGQAYLSNRPLLFIGVLLVILGIQFISIGLLGEMITRSQAPNHKFSIRKSLGV